MPSKKKRRNLPTDDLGGSPTAEIEQATAGRATAGNGPRCHRTAARTGEMVRAESLGVLKLLLA